MQEKRRTRTEFRGAGGRGFWDDLPGDAEVMATVAHGPYAEQIPVANMTVDQIRERYRDRFDINPESLPYVDGEPVTENTVLQAGQVLMFMRRAGEKGETG